MREELRIPFKSLPVPLGGRFGWSSQPLTGNRKRSHLCGLRYSRVVRFRPRDAFFLLTFYFSFDTIITELIEKQPKKRNIMKFSEEQLLVIESALMAARDNAGDEDWHDELSEVLVEVRNELKEA